MVDMERIINIFRDYGDDYWTIRQQLLFIHIGAAGTKGISLTELEENVQVMTQQQINKNCGLISNDPSRPGYKGYDIVQIEEDNLYAKRKRVTLTPKGFEMLEKLNAELNRMRN